MTGVIDMLHYTFFPQDQKTLGLLSQLIAARLLAPPRKEDRR